MFIFTGVLWSQTGLADSCDEMFVRKKVRISFSDMETFEQRGLVVPMTRREALSENNRK